MSLTAFNRARRIKQLQEMKPENIQEVEETIKVETSEIANNAVEVVDDIEANSEEKEVVEESKTSRGRRSKEV